MLSDSLASGCSKASRSSEFEDAALQDFTAVGF